MARAGPTISEDLMKAVSGQFDVLSVRRLRLPGRRLERCDGVEAAAELAMLDLGNNAIEDLAPLETLTSLTSLHLADNRITSLSSLAKLTSLTHLHLQGNRVSKLEELEFLRPLQRLRVLILRDPDGRRTNPVCEHPGYVPTVVRLLPRLEMLDGEHLLLRDVVQRTLSDAVHVDPSEVGAPATKPWISDLLERDPVAGRFARRTASGALFPPSVLADAGAMAMYNDLQEVVTDAYTAEQDALKLLDRAKKLTGATSASTK